MLELLFHPRLRAFAGFALAGSLGCAIPLVSGCKTSTPRLQKEEESDKDRYGVQTVGEVTSVGNAQPVPVGGIGLIIGLEGTGAEPANDANRTILEDDLRKEGVKNIKEVLASSNVALVLVSASIPPGARKGDAIDIEVQLPPRAKGTSLKGGFLRPCGLFNYDFASNLSARFTGPATMVRGHTIAKAEGPLLVGFSSGDDEIRQKAGRIWSGGKVMMDMPFTLLLNPKEQSAKKASQISDKVNALFQSSKSGNNMIATAQNKMSVTLQVPPQYKLNMPRYLRVVRLVPMGEGSDRSGYRKRLADDLIDPATTVIASLRLEALGQESMGAFKRALKHENPLVRFCAAESLCYLGSAAGADELAKAALEQPMLRSYALAAMASMDEGISQIKLRDLLLSDTDDELRYGAFRALRTLDEGNDAVAGELINDAYWFHEVAPETRGLVHICTARRAEIVVFGPKPVLRPPFSVLAGEFTITTADDDNQCTISRISSQGGQTTRKSSGLGLDEVLKTMGTMGALYPDVLEVIEQLDRCKAIPFPVRHDALPRAVSVQELVHAGRVKGGDANDDSIIRAADDLGATPNLYAGPNKKGSFGSSARERILNPKSPKNDPETASATNKRSAKSGNDPE